MRGTAISLSPIDKGGSTTSVVPAIFSPSLIDSDMPGPPYCMTLLYSAHEPPMGQLLFFFNLNAASGALIIYHLRAATYILLMDFCTIWTHQDQDHQQSSGSLMV
jgi:hypothetical protein